jgi:hypothetical protein
MTRDHLSTAEQLKASQEQIANIGGSLGQGKNNWIALAHPSSSRAPKSRLLYPCRMPPRRLRWHRSLSRRE